MTIIVKPPHYNECNLPRLFLAGSIEQGTAHNWQEDVQQALADMNIIIYNPRRESWDPSWVQAIDNPEFKEQVEWELREMRLADLVAFYFQPGTLSPISLFELGLCVNDNHFPVVYCPEGYWRKGNVDIYCEHFGIEQASSFEEFIRLIKKGLSAPDDSSSRPDCVIIEDEYMDWGVG